MSAVIRDGLRKFGVCSAPLIHSAVNIFLASAKSQVRACVRACVLGGVRRSVVCGVVLCVVLWWFTSSLCCCAFVGEPRVGGVEDRGRRGGASCRAQSTTQPASWNDLSTCLLLLECRWDARAQTPGATVAAEQVQAALEAEARLIKASPKISMDKLYIRSGRC